MIAGQDAQTAGVDRHRFVQPELGGEVRDRTRPENAGVARAPRVLRLQILLHPAVRMIDAAVQRQLRGARLELVHVDLLKQRNRVVIAPLPEDRIEIAKQCDALRIPAPPEIARTAPASRRWTGATNCPSVRASLTMGASCTPAVASMLTSSSLNTRGSVVWTTSTPWSTPRSMTGTPRNVRKASSPMSRKYLNLGCALASGDHDRLRLLRHQPGQSLGDAHPNLAHAFRQKTDGGREHEVGAVLLEHVHGADIGREPLLNQVHDGGEGFSGIAAVRDELADVLD